MKCLKKEQFQFIFVLGGLLFSTHSFAEVQTEVQTIEFETLADDQQVETVEVAAYDSLTGFSAPELTLQGNQVQVLGKGIQDRRTGKIIQFLCVQENPYQKDECGLAAFFELDSQKAGSYHVISKIFEFSRSHQNVGDIRKYLKKSIKTIRRNHKDGFIGFYGVGATLFGGSIWLAINTVGGGIAASAMTAGTFALMLSPVGVFTGLCIVGLTVGIESLDITHMGGAASLVSTKAISGKFDDQGGWNWSVDPKKIGHKKFEEMFEAIRRL